MAENTQQLKSIITLTYGANYPMSGRVVKRDLNLFLTRMRQTFGPFPYVWFLEFQRRGAPHVHVLAGLDEADETCRIWFAGVWAGIASGGLDWPYVQLYESCGRLKRGSELSTLSAIRYRYTSEGKYWEAVRSSDGAARYAAKYALKTYQKEVPAPYRNVGRFWGASRDVTMGDGEIVTGTEEHVRSYLREKGRDMSGFDVLPKYCLHS